MNSYLTRTCSTFIWVLLLGVSAGAQVSPIDYNDPNNWASNHHLNKYLPFDPSYTIIDPDTTVHTVVNVPYDTTSNVDIFYVYPTQPYSRAIGAAASNENWNSADSINPIIQMQATQYGRFGRIYAPYYRQANLATFVWPTVTMEEQANTLDTANVDVIAAFEHYMTNYNNGKMVILAGHSQGSIMLHQMIRRFEQDLATYQPYLDKICVSVLGGYGGPTVEFGSTSGGWTENYPICQQPDDISCIMAWQCYRHTANIQTVLSYAHIYNDSLVGKGYRYASFDTLQHEVLLDSLGYSTTKPIPLMIFPSLHPDYGVHYAGVTTDFIAYEDMYEAYYEASSTGAGLKLKRIFQLGDKRKSPFPILSTDFHSWDHSCFSGDVHGLVEYKLGLHVGLEEPVLAEASVFPNPASEQIQFHLENTTESNYQVVLRNLNGALVHQSGLFTRTINIDVSPLAAGVYLYIIKSEEGRPVNAGKVIVR